jgi:radical SAM superfamily enzyme YgiQ (UPF0313 family)
MNILFISPPVENIVESYKKKDGKVGLDFREFGAFPPLGLLYILAYLEKYAPQHKLYLIDCVSEKISYEQLEQKIIDTKPDIVGITSFSVLLIDIIKVAKIVKKHFPKVHISMGGHHSMCFPEQAIAIKEIDSISIGDGEKSFFQLVQALENNQPIDNITGIYTKESIKKAKEENSNNSNNNNKLLVYPIKLKPAFIENLDELPFPARKYLSHIKFYSMVGISNKFTTIISSRGCPYHCIMCDVPYKKYRARSIKNIVDEIEQCISEGYEEFHFYDDMFNITPQRVIEFSQELIKRKLNIIWDFRGRVNTVTKESLKIAKKAGLRMISFGVETGTNEGLKYIKKGTTIEQIKNAFKICRELKIITIADYMVGLPFEKTRQDVINNIDFCISLKPNYAMFSLLTLFPNTPIYFQAIEKGLIDPNKWINFCLNPTKDFYLDHWDEFFTNDELLELYDLAYKRFYFRIPYIIQSIFYLKSFSELIRKIKGFFVLLLK